MIGSINDILSQTFSLWNFILGKPRYVSIPSWSRSSVEKIRVLCRPRRLAQMLYSSGHTKSFENFFFGFMMKRNLIWQISNNSLVRKKTKFFRRIDRTQLAHNMKPNECFYKILWIVKHIVCKFVQPSLNTGKSLSWSGLKKKKLIGSKSTHRISGHF